MTKEKRLVELYKLNAFATNEAKGFDYIYWPAESIHEEQLMEEGKIKINLMIVIWDGTHPKDSMICTDSDGYEILITGETVEDAAKGWRNYNKVEFGYSQSKLITLVKAAKQAVGEDYELPSVPPLRIV